MIVLTDKWPASLAAYRGILARCVEAETKKRSRDSFFDTVMGEGICLARGESAE